MSKIKKVHRTGALGMLMAEGGLPTVNEITKTTVSDKKQKLHSTEDKYTEIDPNTARNWHLNDRPETELGDIEAFAKELVEVGQQQPCIVRPIDDPNYQYEVIAGERRWRATKHAKIKLKVIIRVLDDHDAAISQAAENAQRKDLSDYAKGMSYHALIKQGILKREEIEEKLGISSAQVSRLLSFADLPDELVQAINNFSLVSARTAAELRTLSNKGEQYIQALLELASKISSGTLQARKLHLAVEKLLSTDVKTKAVTREIKGLGNKRLFTWKQDTGNKITLSFSKELFEAMEQHHGIVEQKIVECLEEICDINQ